MKLLFLITFLIFNFINTTEALYDFLNSIYNEYKNEFDIRNNTHSHCLKSCKFDIHGFYDSVKHKPTQLIYKKIISIYIIPIPFVHN